MPAVHDYICKGCGEVWMNHIGRPIDHECGEPDVNITWMYTKTIAMTGPEFNPIVHDGITYNDKSSWEAYKGRLADNLGVEKKNINIVSDSKEQRKVLAEEKFHSHNNQREKKGHKPREFKV